MTNDSRDQHRDDGALGDKDQRGGHDVETAIVTVQSEHQRHRRERHALNGEARHDGAQDRRHSVTTAHSKMTAQPSPRALA